jgi:site-specific DNA-adenine methylase
MNSDLFASSAFRAAHGVYDFKIEVYKHVTLQVWRTMATGETVPYYAPPYRPTSTQSRIATKHKNHIRTTPTQRRKPFIKENLMK